MHDQTFRMPDGFDELKTGLEETWPTISAGIRASGVPTNEVPEAGAGDGLPVDPAAGDQLAGGAAAGDVVDGGQEPEQPLEQPAEPQQPQYDPLEWEAMQNRMAAYEAERGQLLAALEQRGAGPAAAGEAPGFEDLYDEYGQLRPDALAGIVAKAAQDAVAPFQEQITQAQAEQAAAQREEHYGELVEDIIADDLARNGDLASTPEAQKAAMGLLEARAMQLLPALNAKYGTNPDGTTRPGVLSRAIEQAASEVRAFGGGSGASAVEQERNRLGELAGQRGEPGAGGGAAHEAPVVRIGERVVDRYAAAGR